MEANLLEPAVGALLACAGHAGRPFSLEPLSASGNNRVFTVHTGGERLVLKWYFHDPADTRDRLGVEYAFLEHAWNIGLRCVPRPYAKNPQQHIALYEFVAGTTLAPQDIGPAQMEQAAVFLASLNSRASRTQGVHLPAASEACFSIASHLAMVDARLARFADMSAQTAVESEAAGFVRRLESSWQETRSRILAGARTIGLDKDAALGQDQRCLSPSDFGFHNALQRADGSLCFIDFEYAGWDDLAKAMGDFFAHPGVPVVHDYFEGFLSRVLASYDRPDQMAALARLLEPVFRTKWCCIILNEFLPVDARRRNFANPGTDVEERKQRQLAKAKRLFESIQ